MKETVEEQLARSRQVSARAREVLAEGSIALGKVEPEPQEEKIATPIRHGPLVIFHPKEPKPKKRRGKDEQSDQG